MHNTQLSRRNFLGLGAAAAAAALVPAKAFAAGAPAAKSAGLAAERCLSFFHTHTGERLTTAYCAGGDYLPHALANVNTFSTIGIVKT